MELDWTETETAAFDHSTGSTAVVLVPLFEAAAP
jgi:hypothetical protein